MAIYSVGELAQAAEWYVSQLSAGTTLAHMVSRKVNQADGDFFVALPDGSGPQAVMNFEWEPAQIRMRRSERMMELAALTKKFLSRGDCGVLLQDFESSLSDPWMQQYPHRDLATAYNDEIYWTLTDSTVSQASLEEVRAIIEASLYPSIAFFYVGGISAPKTALSVADLEYVVQNLVGVAVGAFDECSFLMWWRRTSVPFPARTEPIA